METNVYWKHYVKQANEEIKKKHPEVWLSNYCELFSRRFLIHFYCEILPKKIDNFSYMLQSN